MTPTLHEEVLAEIPKEIRRFVRIQGDIAFHLGHLIKIAGYTQKEFADKVKMKPSQLSKILSGGGNLTLKTIARMEAALDADILILPVPIEYYVGKGGAFFAKSGDAVLYAFPLAKQLHLPTGHSLAARLPVPSDYLVEPSRAVGE